MDVMDIFRVNGEVSDSGYTGPVNSILGLFSPPIALKRHMKIVH